MKLEEKDEFISGPDSYGFSKYRRPDGTEYYSRPMTEKDREHQKAVDEFYRQEAIWRNRHEIADEMKKRSRGE